VIKLVKKTRKVYLKNAKIGILLAGASIASFNNNCLGYEYKAGKLELRNWVNDYAIFSYGIHDTSHGPRGKEGYAYPDLLYCDPPFWMNPNTTKIISRVDGYELGNDTRPLDSFTSVDLELSLHSEHNTPITVSNLENELWCNLPFAQSDGYDFGNTPITFWEKTIIDPNGNPNDPNNYTISFMADVREAIDKSDFYDPWTGVKSSRIILPKLNDTYESQAPYMYAQVRFNTFPGDFNLRSRVDLEDFTILANEWGRTDVNSIADISGPDGIPDKNVDVYDLALFTRDYLKDANDPNTW
jgi:hypothetical protein